MSKQLSGALAKKIAEARATAGGNRIKDGSYVFVVRKIILDEKFKGNFFIAEFDVLMSASVRDDVEPNKVGTDCSMALNLDTNKSTPGNMKQFFCALLGKEDGELQGQDYLKEVAKYVDDDQPGRGMLIEATTYRKTTLTGPNAGKEGTYPRFATVSTEADEGGMDNSAARIKARRAELDAAGH
jgi:hypothetical protein